MAARPINIAVLGVSGSIGQSVLRVIRQFPDDLRLTAATVNTSVNVLGDVVAEFSPDRVVVSDAAVFNEWSPPHGSPSTEWLCGSEALSAAVTADDVDVVVSALVGFSGLVPTLDAVRAGKDIALANKEVLVVAGELVVNAARERGVRLIPIDSEINAIQQLLNRVDRNKLERIIITASGGALRDWDKARIEQAGVVDVLNHPTWAMGKKITVDSASLVNKAFEVIETHWFFDMPYDRIDVIVHPESIVHSLIEMKDGALFAHMCPNDMVFPIHNALLSFRQHSGQCPFGRLRLEEVGQMGFYPPDFERFPSFRTVVEAGRRGGTYPALVNRLNEINVARFLDGEIPFGRMPEILARGIEEYERCFAFEGQLDMDRILAADRWAEENWGRIARKSAA